MEYSIQLVFDQLQIASEVPEKNEAPLLFGGPNQPERGFVVHRPTGTWRSSIPLHDDVTVTTSNDIIRAIAGNNGPKDVLVALGFSGWSEGALEKELFANQWLVCPFHAELLYDVPFAERWFYAGKILGVNMNQLSSDTGHA
jgi:putative transcriptional regulator